MKKFLRPGFLLSKDSEVVRLVAYASRKIMGCSTSTIAIQDDTTKTMDGEDFVEGVVCKDSEIADNQMKTFDLKDAGKVLLIRHKGKLSALGTKCTHYGAPLVNAALGDGRLRCQWHGACFDITTGDIEDFPGFDSLPCYQVTVENDEVKVRARRVELETNKRVKTMAHYDPKEAQKIVVVGGGPAAAICVETLRQEGFQGRIIMIAKENYLPYDRVKVSKTMDFPIEKGQFRTPEFYRENGIEILLNTEAVKVDPPNKSVQLNTGKVISYDRLFLATGMKPNKVKMRGSDLKNVIVLRNYDHATYTNSQLTTEKHVVVLGSSFIGMEAAAYAVNKVASVTVVARDDVPFKASFGPEIGAVIMKLFEEKGVHFKINSGIKKCIDDGNGALGSVELTDGTALKADVCLMGVGSSMCTEFLQNSGVGLFTDKSVEVDEFMQTNIPGIFAGGDIAHAPVWSRGNLKAAIGHFGLAHYHGRIAALNMLNKQTPLQAVPFFWTMLFGKSFRYAGHGNYDRILYHGNVEEMKFVAFYLKGNQVVALSSCQMDPVVSQYAELLAQGKQLHQEDLQTDPMAWTKDYKSVK